MTVVDEVAPAPTQAEYERLLGEIKKLQLDGKLPTIPTHEQRVSFAYDGNTVMSNPNITMELVERVARENPPADAPLRSLSIGQPMIRKLLIWPDRDLQLPSLPVDAEDQRSEQFKVLVEDMFETMRHHRGVGLAAVQVGIHSRLFVMETETTSEVFINPVIVEKLGKTQPMDEGCLSLPGIRETIMRYEAVRVDADHPITGTRVQRVFEGLEAQCIQHEIEHLDGMTIADSFKPMKRERTREKIANALKGRL